MTPPTISIPCRPRRRMNWNWTAKAIPWSLPARARGWWRCEAVARARTHQLSASMQDLAALLSKQLSRPVTDATGLKGRYEFTLSWMAGVPAQDGPTADFGPDLLAAVQQQLGLKLEASKGPVEVLVIDHLEKDPIEN